MKTNHEKRTSGVLFAIAMGFCLGGLMSEPSRLFHSASTSQSATAIHLPSLAENGGWFPQALQIGRGTPDQEQ